MENHVLSVCWLICHMQLACPMKLACVTTPGQVVWVAGKGRLGEPWKANQ